MVQASGRVLKSVVLTKQWPQQDEPLSALVVVLPPILYLPSASNLPRECISTHFCRCRRYHCSRCRPCLKRNHNFLYSHSFSFPRLTYWFIGLSAPFKQRKVGAPQAKPVPAAAPLCEVDTFVRFSVTLQRKRSSRLSGEAARNKRTGGLVAEWWSRSHETTSHKITLKAKSNLADSWSNIAIHGAETAAAGIRAAMPVDTTATASQAAAAVCNAAIVSSVAVVAWKDWRKLYFLVRRGRPLIWGEQWE